MKLRNQLVVVAENISEENLSLVKVPTKSKFMDEQLRLGHKFVEDVELSNKQICLTLLQYIV